MKSVKQFKGARMVARDLESRSEKKSTLRRFNVHPKFREARFERGCELHYVQVTPHLEAKSEARVCDVGKAGCGIQRVPKASFGTIQPQKRLFSSTELSANTTSNQSHLAKEIVPFIEETEIAVGP